MNNIDFELLNANKEVSPEAYNAVYEREIERRIRQKYSLNSELAILRQRDSKPEEYAEYNAYVEQCKAEVKALFGMKEGKEE